MTAAKTTRPNRSDDMAAAHQAGFALARLGAEQSSSVFKSSAPLLTTAESHAGNGAEGGSASSRIASLANWRRPTGECGQAESGSAWALTHPRFAGDLE
jgi:hypothetical protein